jgi:DNA replication protein DnaC
MANWERDLLRCLLIGPTRVGKTTLACAIQSHLMKNAPLRYLLNVDANTSPRFVVCGDDLKPANNASLLCLDDLGAERSLLYGAELEKATRTIARIIRTRHDAQARTIYTTGLTKDQLIEVYGAHIAARLFDRAAVIEWPFEGDAMKP